MNTMLSTQWPLVLTARSHNPEADAALAQLCNHYRTPVLNWCRATHKNNADAEDATQAFFAQFIAQRGGNAQAERGQFRHYLRAQLRLFWRMNGPKPTP